MENEKEKTFSQGGINWYPGHMANAKRILEDNLKLIDVVVDRKGRKERKGR